MQCEKCRQPGSKQYLLLLLILAFSLPSYGQLPKVLKDAGDALKTGTETMRSLNVFIDATKRTTAQFNKSVKVVKSNSPAPAVPADQVTKPKYKKGEFTNFKWEPIAYFDGQIFPSMVISMANYNGDIDNAFMNSVKSSALGFRFLSDKSYIPVKWEIESSDKSYFDKVSGDFMSQQAGQEVYFMPNIPWNMSTLTKQISSSPINIIFRVFDEDGNKSEKSIPLFMRSINDCIYRYHEQKFDFLFTAFIQEQHPEIDKILKEALNTKLVSAISGYQGDDVNTILQVAAIWKVLHDRGFQYSSVTTTSTNSTNIIASQAVRTFDNSMKTNQANCVDGTVVFASLLRAINISTVMVLTHNHCFLGFYTSRKKNKILYLETTMLSNADIIDQVKPPSKKNQAYVDQFMQAVKYASNKEYPEYKAANDLVEIDVDYYRNFVRPLPF
ncbi:hypothetical protein SAMN05428949_6845 [Chitinophaga sp. YR627]|uniref:hypothetical protein n=1 Tax=Chitinophaga sp. YR627 TaxID=1881041 RepID=UPI0008EB5CA3|nr:hypothetical protein [Chitinophaga sp. YR627]SFO87793.1 hypothetical protein SAMN05428949_6845 [Chitinophaga sp. YR627]